MYDDYIMPNHVKDTPEECTCNPWWGGPDDGCPWHGKRPYLACNDCNYDKHICPGCGKYLDHGQGACEECKNM